MLSRQHRGTLCSTKQQQAAESVTDSGYSAAGVGAACQQQGGQYKNRHASESSYVMNESEVRIPLETVSANNDNDTNNKRNILSLYCAACVVNKDSQKRQQQQQQQTNNTTCHSNEDATVDTRLGREVETRYCRRFSVASNNISNSSLKDVDRSALEDELSAYMVEISNRQF